MRKESNRRVGIVRIKATEKKKKSVRRARLALLYDHLVEDLLNALGSTGTLIDVIGHLAGACDQGGEDLARVLKASRGLHVCDSIALDLDVGRFLLENVDKLKV